MARKYRHVSPPTGANAAIGIAEVSKQEFGRRLQHYMLQRGWKQSDLARAAFGSITNPEGYKVAKNRELISQFVGGKSFPSPLTLHKIAGALNVKPEDLMPQIKHQAIEGDSDPEIDFKVAQGRGDEGLLRINRIVSLDKFARIVAILKEEDERPASKKR